MSVGDDFFEIISTQRVTHLSQIYASGPEINFSTASSVLPQNEQTSFFFPIIFSHP